LDHTCQHLRKRCVRQSDWRLYHCVLCSNSLNIIVGVRRREQSDNMN
jgi:hypothetical protein